MIELLYTKRSDDEMLKPKRKTLFMFAVIGLCILVAVVLWSANNSVFSYSNLADDESKAEAQALLSNNGIPQENIDLFINLVDDFYSTPYNNTVKSGWKKAVIPLFSYSDKDAADHAAAQPDSIINCRMTAFLIMKDNLSFTNTEFTPTENKDPQSRIHLTDEDDLTHYDLLFSNIKNASVNSSETLAQSIIEHWDTAGIEFPNSKVQLVTAYGASGSTIQNFHTAVAVYDDDCVWLLEKYDPLYPYQFSCFSNQEQLIAYMKQRVSEAKYAAVFANDNCLWLK